MLTMRHARYLVERALSMYRLVRSPFEAVSVTLFVAKYIVWRVLPARWRTVDTRLRLGGVDYKLAVRGRESFVFHELYIDGIYDRDPSFTPLPGWVVLDLGANAGIFAVQQARRGARVYSFEPNPDCYRRLSETVVRNQLQDSITVVNKAVGSRAGRARLVVGTSTLGGHLVGADDYAEASVTVDVASLDDLTEALDVGRFDLLKIDVEGSESDVLEGAQRTLPHVDRIVLEYHSEALLEEVDLRLEQAGFHRVLCDETSPAEHRGNAYYARPGASERVGGRDKLTAAR